MAIQIEKNGQKIYQNAQKKIKNSELASMLDWLASQEKQHAQWLSELKHALAKTSCDPKLEAMGRGILQDFLGDQTFSLQDADLSRLENMTALLNASIEFKEDIILFYEMIGSFIEDEKTLENLKVIVEEEKQHVKVLKEFRGSYSDGNLAESCESPPAK
jgi:rubrerythrin